MNTSFLNGAFSFGDTIEYLNELLYFYLYDHINEVLDHVIEWTRSEDFGRPTHRVYA